MSNINLKQLYLYPIKSCGGIKISSAKVENTGFTYDRFFAVINTENEILTARENPSLLLISTAIDRDGLRLSRAGGSSIAIDLNRPMYEKIDVQIFKDAAKAILIGPETDTWLSDTLGEKCRLVCVDSAALRTTKSKYNGQEGDYILFSDISPIHLMTEASLQNLNTKLEHPVTMQRFRPNIVVSGTRPYEEDHWSHVSIGECEFEVRLGTPRCKLTTIDPVIAVVDSKQEPLRTLSSYRKEGSYVNFGIYLRPVKIGEIKVTDTIKVISR